MQQQLEIEGRQLTVKLTQRAELALSLRHKPLLAEMELYFSCLLRKKVRFHESDEGTIVTDKLWVSFRPVMTEKCSNDYEGDAPPVTDFPIQKTWQYVPHWLRIDYTNGEWQGEFGYLDE
jgi:hypothetical protein